jgi:hypothetical protein
LQRYANQVTASLHASPRLDLGGLFVFA